MNPLFVCPPVFHGDKLTDIMYRLKIISEWVYSKHVFEQDMCEMYDLKCSGVDINYTSL